MVDKLNPLRAGLYKMELQQLIDRCCFLIERVKMDRHEIDTIRKELERRENVESR